MKMKLIKQNDFINKKKFIKQNEIINKNEIYESK